MAACRAFVLWQPRRVENTQTQQCRNAPASQSDTNSRPLVIHVISQFPLLSYERPTQQNIRITQHKSEHKAISVIMANCRGTLVPNVPTTFRDSKGLRSSKGPKDLLRLQPSAEPIPASLSSIKRSSNVRSSFLSSATDPISHCTPQTSDDRLDRHVVTAFPTTVCAWDPQRSASESESRSNSDRGGGAVYWGGCVAKSSGRESTRKKRQDTEPDLLNSLSSAIPPHSVKLEKEPMKLMMEGGIEELAATPLEEIEKSKLTKDDIDVRLNSHRSEMIAGQSRPLDCRNRSTWNCRGLYFDLSAVTPIGSARFPATIPKVNWDWIEREAPAPLLLPNLNASTTQLDWAMEYHGRFMMRLKLPNGVSTSEQARYLGNVVLSYSEHGCADVTTRQNWQIRGVQLPDVPEIMDGLARVGLTNLQSGMDNVRNPVGNPLAGIDPHEIVDTRPYNNLLSQYITGNGRGNPAVSNLPRKWNVCVVGSHDLFEHPHINDLAYMPAMKNGRFGFNLLVGGFFSIKRCAEAVPLDAWVSGDDVVPVCKAVLEAFRDLGARGNRQKARMMWLIDELGIEGFRSEVAKRMPRQELERSSSEDLIQKDWERRECLGVHPQKQQGLSFVGLHVPVGRVQAQEMIELARLADEYGTGELRLTVEQNIIIPNVKNTQVEALLNEPLLERFSPEPSILMKGLVACTGSQFCGQAIIETKARALKVTEEVQARVAVERPVRMHWTGCPNSCGQVQVADIGFMGCMARDKAGKMCEGVDIYLGGRIGSDSHLGDLYKKAVPCKDLVPVVVDILVERFGALPREMEEEEADDEGN
ncbi:hypothetical protein ACLOJK_013741 [Asimina triloba]